MFSNQRLCGLRCGCVLTLGQRPGGLGISDTMALLLLGSGESVFSHQIEKKKTV